MKEEILKELRQIPGVGKSTAQDLLNLGIRSVEELRDKNPEELYLKHCAQKGMHVDRCVLYVFRCAVAYSNSDDAGRRNLKWWDFKD